MVREAITPFLRGPKPQRGESDRHKRSIREHSGVCCNGPTLFGGMFSTVFSMFATQTTEVCPQDTLVGRGRRAWRNMFSKEIAPAGGNFVQRIKGDGAGV